MGLWGCCAMFCDFMHRHPGEGRDPVDKQGARAKLARILRRIPDLRFPCFAGTLVGDDR